MQKNEHRITEPLNKQNIIWNSEQNKTKSVTKFLEYKDLILEKPHF